MQRSHIAAVLCAALLLGLAACGGQSAPAEEPPADAPEEMPLELPSSDVSYADVYMQYTAVYGALLDEVSRRLETHNAMLESRYPDSYYMNSNYLLLVYAPFNTVYPALGGGLTGEADAAQPLLENAFPDAAVSMTAPGRWEASYTYLDRTSGQEVSRAGQCVWEWDGEAGSFRVRGYVDGNLVEFTEFVPQGDDLYLLYTMTDLALVRYTGQEITELTHVHRISEPPLGSFAGDMRLFSLEEQDFFPRGSVDRQQLLSDADAQYLLTLDSGAMVYSGVIEQDILDPSGAKTAVTWQPIEPITLLK